MFDPDGHARSRQRASARRGEVPFCMHIYDMYGMCIDYPRSCSTSRCCMYRVRMDTERTANSVVSTSAAIDYNPNYLVL